MRSVLATQNEITLTTRDPLACARETKRIAGLSRLRATLQLKEYGKYIEKILQYILHKIGKPCLDGSIPVA